MEKIEIEVYKGQTIYYDTYNDKFTCDISIEDKSKSTKRQSLVDVRKEIDQFVKVNVGFKPFKALRIGSWSDELVEVHVEALRTDNAFKVKEGTSLSSSIFRKKDIDKLKVYDLDIIKEMKEIEDEFDKAIDLKKEKIKKVFAKLKPLDLSSFDIK